MALFTRTFKIDTCVQIGQPALYRSSFSSLRRVFLHRRDIKAFAQGRGKDQDPDGKKGLDESAQGPKSSKGGSFEKIDRRRGRPAHLRNPDDSPLRDANRDFVLGVLTARASRTLVVYLQDTNVNVSRWLVEFMNKNPITLSGTWEDISGDTFLRKLLSMPIEQATLENGPGEPPVTFMVDPNGLGQRILETRAVLAKELSQDLTLVPEDNNEILRQSLFASLGSALQTAPAAAGAEGSGPDEEDEVGSE